MVTRWENISEQHDETITWLCSNWGRESQGEGKCLELLWQHWGLGQEQSPARVPSPASHTKGCFLTGELSPGVLEQ